jgi:hypothetical protein
VVQNVIMPSTHSSIDRIRYAPQIATRNTTTSSGPTSNVGRNAIDSTAAIGIHSTTTTTFQPAK